MPVPEALPPLKPLLETGSWSNKLPTVPALLKIFRIEYKAKGRMIIGRENTCKILALVGKSSLRIRIIIIMRKVFIVSELCERGGRLADVMGDG